MDFNRYISTGEFAALADWFRSDGEVVHYAAGDRFARQGCRNRHCGVVGRGAFRYVHLARSGERHVVGYAFAGEFVGDYVAMCGDRPSQVSIEAMCDCTVCERLARRLAERLTCELYERMLQLYACTPQERYETLLQRCPELLNIVALKELASYLRVRPETLSRIRGRVR